VTAGRVDGPPVRWAGWLVIGGSLHMLDCVNQRHYTTDMAPNKQDVEEMVVALFTLIGGLERAPGTAGRQVRSSAPGHRSARATPTIRDCRTAGSSPLAGHATGYGVGGRGLRRDLTRFGRPSLVFWSGSPRRAKRRCCGCSRLDSPGSPPLVADWESSEVRSLNRAATKARALQSRCARSDAAAAGRPRGLREPTRTD